MAELNLTQISDKLNEEFSGDVRKLIFWFDDKAEFVDDIDSLELNNAQILHLEPHEQLKMKYRLECVDTETNFLIYAPLPKPPIKENHLADVIHYSKEFQQSKLFQHRQLPFPINLSTVFLNEKAPIQELTQRYLTYREM